MNDVYGCLRNIARKALEKKDFDLELKRRENGFLSKTEIFEKMKRFCPKIDMGIRILNKGI